MSSRSPAIATAPGADRLVRRFIWAGYLLGFALGGFFDGILLHQILQWHHLLSAVEGAIFRDLRVQILADGVFHLLMYVIAVVGLWKLWSSSRERGMSGDGRLLLASALIGFGTWHVVDGIVSHWLLGIHRIRMDSPDPLFWDLLWFFVFGVAPIVIGMILRRRSGPTDRPRAGLAASLVLAGTTALGGYVATLPPDDASTVVVLMRPDAAPSDLLRGLAEVGGGILWSHPSGTLWALRLDGPDDGRRLYRHGALVVTASPAALGCLAWARLGT